MCRIFICNIIKHSVLKENISKFKIIKLLQALFFFLILLISKISITKFLVYKYIFKTFGAQIQEIFQETIDAAEAVLLVSL